MDSVPKKATLKDKNSEMVARDFYHGFKQVQEDLSVLASAPSVSSQLVTNVKDYGAVGNGIADDTKAIANAIAARAVLGGGIIYFPKGTYIVNPYVNPITAGYYSGIWVPGHMTLMGAGIDATTIKLGPNQPDSRDGQYVHIIANKNIGATYLDQHIKVCDLTIDGNNTNQGACHCNHGLRFMRLRGGIVENVKAKNILGQDNAAGAGSYDGESFSSWLSTDISYINCIAHRDAGDMSSGYQAINSSNVKYVNCWAIDLRSAVGDAGVGFSCYGSAQVQYANCHSFLHERHGFNAEYSVGVSYIGCVAGGASAPNNETPNGIGTAYAAATDFSNGLSGFVILESTHVQIIGGRSSNTSGIGVNITGAADYLLISGLDLTGNTTPISGTCPHFLVMPSEGNLSQLLSYQDFFVEDEFISGSATSGDIGDLGWNTSAVGAGVPSRQAAVYQHPGIIQIATGATTSDSSRLHLGQAATDTILYASHLRRACFIVRVPAIANVKVRIGLGDDFSGATLGANSAYFEFDPSLSANWQTYTRAAGVSTGPTDTGVAVVAASYYILVVELHSDGNWKFYVNDALTTTHTTNKPTLQINVGVYIQTTTTAAKTLNLDYFSLRSKLFGQRYT